MHSCVKHRSAELTRELHIWDSIRCPSTSVISRVAGAARRGAGRRGFANSQITRRYNSARIYGRRVSGYSGCSTRAAVQTRGENGGTNVRELTMYGVCALSETQIAMRAQRQPDEIRSTRERVKPVRAIHVWLSVDTRAPVYNQRDCNSWGCAEFNRILIFLFVQRRMCRTRAADIRSMHEKCSVLSVYT